MANIAIFSYYPWSKFDEVSAVSTKLQKIRLPC